jgi:ABC-type amino acid transport/signal transduction systems, periplasmic component/domain
MKKIVTFLLAITLFCSSLAACSTNTAANSGAAASKADTKAGATDTSWATIQKKGALILGLDENFPPMGYRDEQTNEIVGFDIDLAKETCKRLGIQLKLQPINWDAKDLELSSGNIDCIWNGLSKTSEREVAYNLSFAYMKNNQVLLVKKDSPYKNLADLKGKTVGVQKDSSAETALNASTEFKSSLKQVVTIDDYSKAVLEIENGTIDAIAIDEVVARYYITKKADAYRLLMKDDKNVESLAVEDYVIGFRKADVSLTNKIEETLKTMAKDGTLATISKKWFSEDVTTVEK